MRIIQFLYNYLLALKTKVHTSKCIYLHKKMSDQKKRKKFSPLIRLLGLSCSLLLIGCVVYIVIVGFSYISGLLLVASLAGLAGPSVASGDGFIEILSGIFELIVEGIQTIVEAVVDIISSIFG